MIPSLMVAVAESAGEEFRPYLLHSPEVVIFLREENTRCRVVSKRLKLRGSHSIANLVAAWAMRSELCPRCRMDMSDEPIYPNTWLDRPFFCRVCTEALIPSTENIKLHESFHRRYYPGHCVDRYGYCCQCGMRRASDSVEYFLTA